jgi:hypothetical protein
LGFRSMLMLHTSLDSGNSRLAYNLHMARFKRWLPGLVLGSLFLVLGGLLHIHYLHCSTINPSWPAYTSDYVQARGFPLAWFVTGDESCAKAFHWQQRLLTGRFLIDFIAFFSLIVAVSSLILRKTRRPG